MRTSYHEELDAIIDNLVHMAELVETAIKEGSESLLTADLGRAEAVISNDAELDQMHEEMEYKCLSLLALQAPVAGELRTIVSAIRVVFELARMGDLAAHVAKIARLRYPEHAVPEPLYANFNRMSRLAQDMIGNVGRILAERDLAEAQALAQQDEEMDTLRSDQFRVILGDDWAHGVEAAVDVALLGRYFERIADHAVGMGRRIIYIITGDMPEGEDWPST